MSMKVVFLANVESNHVGEIREVKNGYARNFLLPRGLALAATKEAVERAHAAARREERRQATVDAEAQSVVARIGEEPFVLTARVGETGRLYGSVTSSDIAEAVSARSGHEIDRRSVELGEPIRQIGQYTIRLRLTRNVHAEITLDVQPEGGVLPEPVAPPPAIEYGNAASFTEDEDESER
jgi:large subunit ribosomal protein L9